MKKETYKIKTYSYTLRNDCWKFEFESKINKKQYLELCIIMKKPDTNKNYPSGYHKIEVYKNEALEGYFCYYDFINYIFNQSKTKKK